MIKVTTKVGRIYINPFWIESVVNDIDNGMTRIVIHTDNENYYNVAESVEEVIKKIEDDRG